MQSPKKTRVTLTKAQAASAIGAELFEILEECLNDGKLDDGEIARLQEWSAKATESVDFPGIRLMQETVSEALEDGIITTQERQEIMAVVLRVLPKAERETVKAHFALLESDSEENEEFATESESTPLPNAQPIDESRPPKCKKWKLFAVGAEHASAKVDWKTIRFLRTMYALSGEELAAPSDDSSPTKPVNEWRFFVSAPTTVQDEVSAILDQTRDTLGGRTPVSDKQKQVLSELHWSFGTEQLLHYRHADTVIQIWAKARNLGEDWNYEDPDSPWASVQSATSGSRGEWIKNPATAAQLKYLRALGIQGGDNLTKGEASDMIDSAVNSSRSVSNRQMMVLRFWNKIAVAKQGRNRVSEWMDDWYTDDPDRKAAWELWKEDNDDHGRQDSPEKVPLGIGYKYLKRVKSGAPGGHQSGGCLAWIVGALIVFVMYKFVFGE